MEYKKSILEDYSDMVSGKEVIEEAYYPTEFDKAYMEAFESLKKIDSIIKSEYPTAYTGFKKRKTDLMDFLSNIVSHQSIDSNNKNKIPK